MAFAARPKSENLILERFSRRPDSGRNAMSVNNNVPLVKEMNLSLRPTLVLCTIGGGILGFILAKWGVSDNYQLIASVTFVFAVLTGLFSTFI
jgi:hypothetical protein